MKYILLAGASALTMGAGSSAMAGNIILTGHDNDFHCAGGGDYGGACEAIGAEAKYVINGSSLPVLAIDAGSELTSALAVEGISYVAIAPSAVTAASFNPALYSAFAVASVTSCGGCDNPTGTGAELSAYNTAIASFFDAGGGILGLTGADDPDAFAYVPEAGGVSAPIFSSSGFVETAAGASIPGFFAVNGDETHNTFSGFASFYQVAETFGPGGPAVTLFGAGGSIGCTGTTCTISSGTPEPSTWAMLGLGFFGLGLAVRRKRSNVQLSATA